jgi:predicted small metal-binding protein
MDVCTEYERTGAGRTAGKSLPMTLCICKDLGMDCSFEANGTTRTEVMKKFIEHAESEHRMNVLTADILYRVQKIIQK